MSFRVLVIPEDPTYNGYIVKPLVDRMMAAVGRPQAMVHVLVNPKVGGYTQAVEAIRTDLVNRYGHWDLWLFLPDADRATDLAQFEKEVQRTRRGFFACAAVPEVEAWLLAGHRDVLGLPWGDLRNHRRLKEDVFAPFLKQWGNAACAGEGRAELMLATLTNYRGLLTVCPELQELHIKITNYLEAQEPQ